MTPDQEFVYAIAKLFVVVFAIACATATIVGGIAFYKTDKGAARSFSELMRRAGILEIVTVILIAAAVSNMRMLDKLSAESTVAILSGIVGYVLGGLISRKKASGDTDEE